jgi:hypothetical protein
MLSSTRSIWTNFTTDHGEVDFIMSEFESIEYLDDESTIEEMTLENKRE